jgi:hypothetical protein
MATGLGRLIAAGAAIAALTVAPAALADGTETLGPPSVAIASGTDVLVAGVGTQTHPNTPASFAVNVPAGATVKQVLAYWQGQITSDVSNPGPDASISLNGSAVAGTLIGDPGNPFLREHFFTYRADVTGLGLVNPGANTLTVSDMNFQTELFGPTGNKGAGVIVIYDDGSTSTVVGVRDGNDYAYGGFASPFDTTVAQTFTFAPADSDRAGSLGLIAGEVLDHDFTGVQGNVVTGRFDTGQTFSIVNGLQSKQGLEFDAASFPVTIPAGAGSLTIQALSQGGDQPASFLWSAATLTVDVEEEPPPPTGGEGCTPGYWKNHLDSWPPTGFAPGQALSTVFSPAGLGSLGSATLLDALKFGGGSSLTAKKQILLRAAVASLLNAAHADVAFGSTPADVIAAVNAALASADKEAIVALAGELDDSNNGDEGCPLN